MDILMMKTRDGALRPLTADDEEQLKAVKMGYVVECKITRKRNSQFHRKFFLLLGVAFEAFCETARPIEYHGMPVLPNLERFRKDITILAGFYNAVYSLQAGGQTELRLEARSISFANMEQEDFEKLYSAVIDVVLSRILAAQGFTEESLRAHVDRVMALD